MSIGELTIQNSKLQSDKAELLAMLIEVRDDVCGYGNYLINARAPTVRLKKLNDRVKRLGALIERMKA